MHKIILCLTANLADIKKAYDIDEKEVMRQTRAYKLKKIDLIDAVKKLVAVYSTSYSVFYIKRNVFKRLLVVKMDTHPLVESIVNERTERLNRVKEELTQENPDPLTIAHYAYNQQGVFFAAPKWGVSPIIMLPDYLKFTNAEFLYIAKAYAYQ